MTTNVARHFFSLLFLLVLSGCAARTHHRDGMDAVARKDYVVAVDELFKAAELDPGDLTYRKDWLRTREVAVEKLLAIAAVDIANGNDKEAEKSYQTILKLDRENARAIAGLEGIVLVASASQYATQARMALKRGDVDQATQAVSNALKAVPAHPEARAIKRELDALQAKELLAVPSLGGNYKKLINLEFRDASLKMIFDVLSRTSGINFIFDRDTKVDQRTTVSLRQTTLDDAIDVILSTNQLERKILNPSSVLIYPGTPAKVREYQDLVVRVFYLSNVEAKQAANLLKTVLKLKEIFVDDKYNMLILRESPQAIALAEKLIALHDLEEPEVMLEVEVLEINRSRLLNLGVQLPTQLTISPLGVTSSGTGGSTPSQANTFRLSDLKNLNSDKFSITPPSATINLQKVDGDANLLANPRIRVRDREKAKILIGDKVPVVTTTSTGTYVSENIQYIDVGLKLEVEPDIHLRDEVGLKINLEVSSLVSSIKTSNGSQAYQIGTRNFSSALRLKDGETQILAGLISDEDRSAANRIPLLGDLPVLGRLFSSQTDNRQKTEIVLSITPHLIRNIQRNDPAAETFWSGTEASLRNRPVQLRSFDPAGSSPATDVAKAAHLLAATLGKPDDPNGLKLAWDGPAQAKVGEEFTLELNLDSPDALRAASLQLAFNPAEIEIVSVDDGEYFKKAGKASFDRTIDNHGGRTSIGASSAEQGGAQGKGRLFILHCRARAATATAEIKVISATPIGSAKVVERPVLPLVHAIAIGQ